MGHLSPQTAHEPVTVQTAPDAVLPKTDGTTASILASGQGKKTILVFWATWCPHCYEELGFINNNIASIEQEGIKIVLVDEGEAKENIQEYFYRRQMKLTSFIDGDSILQEAYHLIGIPTLIFIDEKGIIRSVTHVFPSDYANHFTGA